MKGLPPVFHDRQQDLLAVKAENREHDDALAEIQGRIQERQLYVNPRGFLHHQRPDAQGDALKIGNRTGKGEATGCLQQTWSRAAKLTARRAAKSADRGIRAPPRSVQRRRLFAPGTAGLCPGTDSWWRPGTQNASDTVHLP